jgi:hypothetical protein
VASYPRFVDEGDVGTRRPALRALVARYDGIHGVYALLYGKRVLRVGSAPMSIGRAAGKPLLHHGAVTRRVRAELGLV